MKPTSACRFRSFVFAATGMQLLCLGIAIVSPVAWSDVIDRVGSRVAGCGDDTETTLPSAICQQVESGNYREVRRFSLSGKAFFLAEAECCDRFNDLFDGQGMYICSPSGGYSGGGTGRCPPWVRELDFSGGNVVWQKTRK